MYVHISPKYIRALCMHIKQLITYMLAEVTWQLPGCLLYIADINECVEGTHLCTQNCNNTIGSYVCSCNDGFIIDVDGRTCDGEIRKLNNIIYLLQYMHAT